MTSEQALLQSAHSLPFREFTMSFHSNKCGQYHLKSSYSVSLKFYYCNTAEESYFQTLWGRPTLVSVPPQVISALFVRAQN